jgi:hypothetical protein
MLLLILGMNRANFFFKEGEELAGIASHPPSSAMHHNPLARLKDEFG